MGAIQKIPVGRIHVNAIFVAPAVEAFLQGHLPPLRILQAKVAGVSGGGTTIAGVRAVVFKNVKTRFGHEVLELVQISQAPFTTKTRRIAKKCSAGFTCQRIDYIVLVADASTAK